MPRGTTQAASACRLRVPPGASSEAAALADRALQRMVDVMELEVAGRGAMAVLLAATRIREEVCGPVPRRLETSGPDGGPLVVEIHSYQGPQEEAHAVEVAEAEAPDAGRSA